MKRNFRKARGGFFASEEVTPYFPKGVILGQRDPNACVPACCRMLLFDILAHPQANPDLSESHLRNLFGTNESGSSISEMPEILRQLGVAEAYEYQRALTLEELGAAILRGSALVTVHSASYQGTHAVLIDEIVDNFVAIRDPLPPGRGSAYRLPLEIFMRAWPDETGETHALVVLE
jgi:ABC-type bacteriocin/lantibiotic exporter with double-glycine peptidase domain